MGRTPNDRSLAPGPSGAPAATAFSPFGTRAVRKMTATGDVDVDGDDGGGDDNDDDDDDGGNINGGDEEMSVGTRQQGAEKQQSTPTGA